MKAPDPFPFETSGNVLVVTLQQQLADMEQATVVSESQVLANRFSESAATACVIDFNQLEYFTSTLLEALLRLWNAVKAKGGHLALCNLSPVGHEIIKVAHFDRLWPVCKTREQALQAVLSRCE